jgi:hypothetical protein
MMACIAMWLASSVALAGAWKEQPIEPKAIPDGSAYTLGPKVWRLGLVKQQVGVLDNLDLGIRLPLYALGAPNVHAKVNAIQVGERFDLALDGEIISASLVPYGVPEGNLTLYPVGWTASGQISKRFSVHGGTAWMVGAAKGSLGADELASGIAAATGADISETLLEQLGNTAVYGGANFTLYQTRFQLDYRMNRRDSLVLRSNTWVYFNALVAAGVQTDAGGEGTEVQAGASARVRVPLTDTIQSLTTLSWQFSWRRAHLRVGVPLPLNNTFAWLQAIDFYVLLGKGRTAPSAPGDQTGQ